MTDYKLHAILTVGPSACGKSSWAEQFLQENQGYINLERDNIRFNLFCDGKRDWTRYKFNKKNEALVTEEHDKLLDYAITYGYNLILSDTLLNETYRNNMVDKLEAEGYLVELKDDWDIPSFETLLKRNDQREGGISSKILWDQWLRYLDYKGYKKYIPDESLPKAIICDIDGTVASMQGIRKPYEWSKVIYDEPIQQVVDIVKGLHSQGYKIVFMSGRDGCCMDETLAWLYDIFDRMEFDLYMRSEGDSRKDYIIKRELFDNHIVPHYNVQMAIDDRHSIVELWEQLGIKVINVGNLYNRF